MKKPSSPAELASSAPISAKSCSTSVTKLFVLITSIPAQSIIHLLGNPNFEVLRHDICFPLYAEGDKKI